VIVLRNCDYVMEEEYLKWKIPALKREQARLGLEVERHHIQSRDIVASLICANKDKGIESIDVAYKNWTKVHLKTECARFNLSINGNSKQLLVHLQTFKSTSNIYEKNVQEFSKMPSNAKVTGKRKFIEEEEKTTLKSALSPKRNLNSATFTSSPKKIMFTGVEVREYARMHAGGGGVPHHGGYPLGLDWEYNNVISRSLTEYENMRQDRHSIGIVIRINC